MAGVGKLRLEAAGGRGQLGRAAGSEDEHVAGAVHVHAEEPAVSGAEPGKDDLPAGGGRRRAGIEGSLADARPSIGIEALDEGEETLFLVFADRTSGHGSYGAGRFLDVPRPDAQGRVAIDFNRSYNPPCAFTAFATCPLPPPENRLDLAIAAGEKAYAHSAP